MFIYNYEAPTTDDPSVPIDSGSDAGIEQLIQQTGVSPIVSHIVVGQPKLSADTLHNCDMITVQPCVPQIAKENGQSRVFQCIVR